MRSECPVCPVYVLRCWHVGGRVVWMMSRTSILAERERRGLLGDCPQCGRRFAMDKEAVFAVAGPGVIGSELECVCSTPLTIPWLKPYAYGLYCSEADAIAEGERRIRELA